MDKAHAEGEPDTLAETIHRVDSETMELAVTNKD